MNFDILRRMREADIRIPYPQFGQLRPGREVQPRRVKRRRPDPPPSR